MIDSPPGASSRRARGMSTAWEGDEPRSTGWTRREWAKLALAAGAASSVLAMGGTVAGQLLPPPAKFQGELRQENYYTKWPRPTRWDDRQGRPGRAAIGGAAGQCGALDVSLVCSGRSRAEVAGPRNRGFAVLRVEGGDPGEVRSVVGVVVSRIDKEEAHRRSESGCRGGGEGKV